MTAGDPRPALGSPLQQRIRFPSPHDRQELPSSRLGTASPIAPSGSNTGVNAVEEEDECRTKFGWMRGCVEVVFITGRGKVQHPLLQRTLPQNPFSRPYEEGGHESTAANSTTSPTRLPHPPRKLDKRTAVPREPGKDQHVFPDFGVGTPPKTHEP